MTTPMSEADITKHVVRDMYFVEQPQSSDPRLAHPVLQVINVKKLPPTGHGDGRPRTRVVISDGTHFFQSMMASQVDIEHLKEHCVVRLDKYMVNKVSDRTVVILLDITVLGYIASGKIGTPTDVELAVRSGGGAPMPAAATENQPLYNNNNHPAAPEAKRSKPNPYGGGASPSSNNPYGRASRSPGNSAPPAAPIVRASENGTPITSIANLNMYNNRWTIRARVTSKSDIKTWSNSKGEGSLFSLELLDESMDIRATMFKEAVDKFYHFLEPTKVYTFSGGRLKVANMQWNTCRSNFEITFDQNSEIHLATDDGHIEKQHYEFSKIASIEQKEANQTVDVLAVVTSVGEPANLISKKSGQELTKCDLMLLDDSATEISLTLWGEQAQSAPQKFANTPVVAFRKARIGDYNGKSLNAGSAMDIRPELPEAHALQQWYQQSGGTAQTRSLSSSMGGGRMDSFADRKTISSIKDENMGMLGDKPDWLSFKATLSFLKKDREGGAWYPACANSGEPCKNRFKVTQTTDGQWYCAKCEHTYPNPVRRWIFSGVVEDPTGSTWVSFFNEQAESLLEGKTADACYEEVYGNGGGFDPDMYDSAFSKALFSEWIIKCKVKNEIHNEESRVKASVYSLHPVDYAKESKDLLAAIATF